MRANFFKSPPIIIAAAVVFVVSVLYASGVSFLERLEWMTYDSRVKLAYRVDSETSGNATNLGLAAITDQSIDAVNSGQFGYQFGLYWPRQIYGRALEELRRQGAKAVAFDILFAEERPDQPDYKSATETNSSDEFFAERIEVSSNIILAADQKVFPAPIFYQTAMRVGNIGTTIDLDGVLRREEPYHDFRVWHSRIRKLAFQDHFDLSTGSVDPGKLTFIRKDGTPESIALNTNGYVDVPEIGLYFRPFNDYRAWSLGIILAAKELKLDLDKADIQTNRHRIVIPGPNGSSRVIPLNDDGTFFIDWAIAVGDPNLAQQDFAQLLADPGERAQGLKVENYWSNKLVVIGSTATGNDLSDMGVTPLQNGTFFVSKHWNVANSVITGRFITKTPLPIDLALIIIAGVVSAWITWFTTKPITGSLIIALLCALYVGLAAMIYIRWRIWIPIIAPLLCSAVMTHLLTMTYRVRMELHERKRVRAVFQRVVSPDIVTELLGAKGFSLSSRRELTIYFADVRGFTELSDVTQQRAEAYVTEHKLEAEAAEAFYDEQARDVLNTVSLYLATITNAIKGHRGTLDKYIGDCVMAFWGAPVLNPSHALDATRAAIDAQRALAALNRQREAQNMRRAEENAARVRLGLAPHSQLAILSMGSGINTGVAIAGLMGSENHISNYTVFGREVNLASRLEGVSGHGRIIIGEGTYAALQKLDPGLALSCVELSPQKVKGFRAPVRIYEVPWETGASTGATAFIEKTAFIHKTVGP